MSGALKWVISAGGTKADGVSSVAVDSAGNSYITAGLGSTATIGSTTLTTGGFVAKLDSTGKFLWAVSAGGTLVDRGYGLAADGSGSSYVAGIFHGTATFGSTSLTAKGMHDVFVAKLDGTGKFLWAASAGGTSYDYGTAVAVDSTGNSFVTGLFYGNATFGSTSLTATGYRGDAYVAKLSSAGKFLWAVSFGSNSSDQGKSIAVDSSGNGYVTGSYFSTVAVGSTTLTAKGQSDIFVAKVNSAGKFLWAVSAGGIYHDYGIAIALDSSANSTIAGYFNSGTSSSVLASSPSTAIPPFPAHVR